MFQETLDLVIERYGTRYWNNPEFCLSPDRERLIRLAELLKEEYRIEPNINPELN
jgi:hypothetical protein